MKKEYLLSWSIGILDGHYGGKTKDSPWKDVEKILYDAWERSGTVTIDIFDSPEIGPQSIQIQTEGHSAIITLGVNTDNDYIVRSYSNGKKGQKIEIFGNLWDSKSVCCDYNFILNVFKEFLDTGNVSSSLLN